MKVLLVNSNTKLVEGHTYVTDVSEISEGYIAVEVAEDFTDFMYRKFENGVFSEEKFLPPEPLHELSEIDALNDYIVDMDYRLLLIELGI